LYVKPPGQEVWKEVRVERQWAATPASGRQVPGRAHPSEGELGTGRHAAPAGEDGHTPMQSHPKHPL